MAEPLQFNLSARWRIVPLIACWALAACAVPITNDGRWRAVKQELPALSDSETKHLISKYKRVHPQSPEGQRLAQEIADRGGPNVALEMVKLAGKRTVIPFLPPGPTWEALFFWTQHPYEFHARGVIARIHGPGSEQVLRVLINHDLWKGDAILALWAMRVNLRPEELESLFRQSYLRDWDDLLPIVEHLPKDDAARIFLLYINPGMIRDQEHPASIAGNFDCQKHPLPNIGGPEIKNGVPLSDKQFMRLQRVLLDLRNLQTPLAESCLSSRRPFLRSAISDLEQSREKAEEENSSNYPFPEGDPAMKAHDQLVSLLADIQSQTGSQ